MVTVPDDIEPQDPVRPVPPSTNLHPVDLGGSGGTQDPPRPQPAPDFDAAFGNAWLSREDQQEGALLRAFEVAVKADPDQRAEAQRIAAELNVDPDTVDRTREVMREQVRRQQIRDLNLSATNPALAARMRDIEFARIAHKDVEGLTLFEQIGQNWEAGRLEVLVGDLGDQERRGVLAEADRERLASMRARLRAIGPSSGFVTGLFRTGGQMAEVLPDAIAHGATFGTAAGIAGQLGPQVVLPEEVVTVPTAFALGVSARLFERYARIEAGHSYHELVSQHGVNPSLAKNLSLGVGVLNGALESAGTGFLARAAGLGTLKQAIATRVAEKVAEGAVRPTATKAAVDFAKRYAEGFAGEWATEQLQTIVGIGAGEAGRLAEGRERRMSTEAGRAEIVDELADSAIQAAYGVGLLAGIGPTARYVRDLQRARIAQDVQKDVGTFLDRAAESPMRERSPQAFESFLADATRGTAIETLHVDAQEFGAALRQAEVTETELSRSLPDLAADLSRALREGGDVVIQTSEYAAKVAGALPKLDAALRPHLRTDALEMSPAEAEAFEQKQAQAVARTEGQPQPEQQPAESTAEEPDPAEAATAEEESREVEDAFREQLVGTGKFSRRAARTAASLYRQFVLTQSRRNGVSPAEFAAQFPLIVEAAQRPAAEGKAAAQPGRLRKLLQRGKELLTGEPISSSLQQPGGKDKGPRGEFDPERLRIRLFESADLSTFLHEMGHFFLGVLGRTASAPNAPDGVRADMQTLLEWRGIESLEAWNAMSLEEQRPHHEAFAYNYELLLFEGKAPTPEMRGLLRRFGAWLRSVYRSIRDELGILFRRETGEELPVLTPEIRQVMDRLTASEEAVERAAVRRRGADPASEAAYDEMEESAIEEAIAEVERKVLGTMRGLEGARDKRIREMQAEAKEVRAEVKNKVAAEVAQWHVYRVLRWLKSGRLEEGQEADTNHRLRRSAVEALGIPNVPDHWLSHDGVLPDVVAEQIGFDSGDQMVRALVAAPPLKDAIEQATDARMMAEHTELADPREMRRTVAEALANDVKAQMLAQELRDVAKLTENKREIVAAAKERARDILANTPVGRVDPSHFLAQEQRAAARAEEAMRKGDAAAVITARNDQIVRLELVKLAAKAQRGIDKTLRTFDRLWQADEKLGKQRNLDIVNAARSVLGAHNLASGRAQQRAAQWIEAVAAYDEQTAAELLPVVQRAMDGAKDYRKLTHAEFEALTVTIDELWHRSKRSREIEVGGKRMLRDQAIDELVPLLQARLAKEHPGTREALTKAEMAGRTMLGVRAGLGQLEHFLIFLDGGKEGPFTRYLWNEPRAAYDRYMLARIDETLKLHGIVEDVKFGGGRIAAPELDYTFKGGAELFGALLHIGNLGNLARLVVGGRGAGKQWGQWFEDGSFDASGWWRFFDRATREGIITEKMMDAVQEVWNQNERLKPDLQRMHHALYGAYFEEVEAVPIKAFGKTYKGGYMPATPDPELAPETERRQIAEASLDQKVREAMPRTPQGSLKSRVQRYARPLILDARLQVQHLDEVLRFLHVQSALTDALGIVRHPRFRSVADQYDPKLVNEVLLPAYDRLARNRISTPGMFPWFDTAMRFLRESSGMAWLGGNIRNALQQFTGIVNAGLYVKSRHLSAAAWHFVRRNPWRVTNEVVASSDYMRLLLKEDIGQLHDDLQQALKPNWFMAKREWTRRNAYFAQRFTQNIVNVVTWVGAKNQALVENPSDHDGAVRAADRAVRLSQGDRTPLGVAKFESGTPFARLFTQFTSYANSLFNQVAFAQPGAAKAKAAVFGVVATSTLAALIAWAMSPDEPEKEDEDGFLPGWAKWFMGEQLRTIAAMAPGVGSTAASIVRSDGSRVTVSPAVDAARSAYAGILAFADLVRGEREELSARNVRDVLTAIGLLSGMPIGAYVRPALDLMPSEPR